jgi:hypothetical protein
VIDVAVRFFPDDHGRRMTIVPPNPAMVKLRINVIDAPPASLMSRPSSRQSPGPFANPRGQRRKLWEFSTSMHCSIVGTCLSTLELRKIIAKVKGHDLKGFSDLIIHEEAVLVAGHHGAAAQLLQKALDRRYEATTKRFNRAQNVDEARSLRDDARRNGEIPGAYWALLTHPAKTQELRQSAFGDIHMLSHLVGAANRSASTAFAYFTSVGGRRRFLASEPLLRRHRGSFSTTTAVWKNGRDYSPVW